MDIFGIGAPELLIVLVIALLVLGPQRMVGLARRGGKMVRSLRQMTGELTQALTAEEEEPPTGRSRGQGQG